MANSGIFFNVREVPGKPIYYAAPEIQVLDNVDATDNKVASHLAGSLYDMIAADPKLLILPDNGILLSSGFRTVR